MTSYSYKWIIVFDLDDTLVTGYFNKKGEAVKQIKILDDTLTLLEKAIQSKNTVQAIYLYTYNDDHEYVYKAISAIEKKLNHTDIFDSIIFKNDGIYTLAHTKSVDIIQAEYNSKKGSFGDDITSRILFIDNKVHPSLYNSIGHDHYSRVPYTKEDELVPDEKNLDLIRYMNIKKISKLIDNQVDFSKKKGGKQTRKKPNKMNRKSIKYRFKN